LEADTMYRSILVPLDGSRFSEHALPLVAAIAGRSAGALEVVQVHPPSVVGEGITHVGAPDTEVWREEKTYLDGAVEKLEATTGVRATARVLDGPVAETLQEYILGRGTDLVVMTTHGRGPLSRFWLGSIADALVHRLPIPLLLVRPQTALPAAAPKPHLQHLLIALDGSRGAEEILPPAVELGRLMGAHFTLLRVVPPPPVLGVELTGYATGGIDLVLLEKLQNEARAYLARTADGLRRQGLAVQTRVVAGPHVPSAILDEADVGGCDLIALETHGRRGLSRLFLGSVADKVVRGSPASVLVHRSLPR
jgi:nucleotide-binding universal stress UspA family protein